MQRTIVQARSRFNVVDCGRRWGKTQLGMNVAMQAMVIRGWPVAWFAPTYKYLADVWRDMRETLQPYTTRADATEKRIELVTGGTVDMWSLDGGEAGRGRKYARVVVDEAAMVPALWQVWTAAIRPTLTDLRGDAWFLSTPKGRNDFWRMYTLGLDELEPEWACWQMPTSTNPIIDEAEIEAARRELPDSVFRQEYLAEFLEDGAVFTGLEQAAHAEPQAHKDYNNPHKYVIGVDWGQMEDYSVFTVVDVDKGEACYIDRSNKIEYMTQVQRLKELVKRFDAVAVQVETNGQATTIELLRKERLPLIEFTTNNDNKQAIITDLMLAFEKRDLKIISNPVLMAELQAFEAARLPSGRLRYAAPDGYHDDCVMSLALAWQAAKVHNRPPVTVRYRKMA